MLENGTIRIRCAEENDLDFIYSCSSPSVRGDYQEFQFQSWQSVVRVYEGDGFWNDRGGVLIVESENEAVGLLYITFVREGLARLGMVLLPDSRRQGIGSGVLPMITDYLLDNYPIVRIEADTDTDNLAAQHVLENSGFVLEGTLRKYRYHHGFYHDSLLYSFTAP